MFRISKRLFLVRFHRAFDLTGKYRVTLNCLKRKRYYPKKIYPRCVMDSLNHYKSSQTQLFIPVLIQHVSA